MDKENMNKENICLLEISGRLPPYPLEEVDRKLTVRNKFIDNIVECLDGSMCSSCCTLTPYIPKSHDKSCYHYEDLNEYPEVRPFLGGCPECKEDSLSITSSVELGVSSIECSECSFTLQDTCCEEDLMDRFLAYDI